MIPKFANPHFRGQDFELVSRAQLRSDVEPLVDMDCTSDVEITTSKRKLHELLFSEFGECLSTASSHAPRKKKRCNEKTSQEDGLICIISSAFQYNTSKDHINYPETSTQAKVIVLYQLFLPLMVFLIQRTRPPVCEDNPIQADERMRHAQSVAVDFAQLDARSKKHAKPFVQDDKKLIRIRGNLPVPHPAVMVTESHRDEAVRRQAPEPLIPGAIESPHSLRATCIIFPVAFPEGSQSHRKTRAKTVKKKPSRQHPPPAYWRPSSNQRGKCVGYGLGYPGSWSVRYEGDPRKRWYVRDTMKKATFSS
ncbi:hypothetical protein BDR04DRAFT_1230906 [Suillus decipiens]|nr:hypothetical protein BDR04DRAFT_1230906 [Suillus decipiens]